jgi:hypothetical protein
MIFLLIGIELFFITGLLSLGYQVRKGEKDLRWGVGSMLVLVLAVGLLLISAVFSYYHLAGADYAEMATSLFFSPIIVAGAYCTLRYLQLRSEITVWFSWAYRLVIVFLVVSWLRSLLWLFGVHIMPNSIFRYVVLLGLIVFWILFWRHHETIRKKQGDPAKQ